MNFDPNYVEKKYDFFLIFAPRSSFLQLLWKVTKIIVMNFVKENTWFFAPKSCQNFNNQKLPFWILLHIFETFSFLSFFTVVKFLSFCANIKYQKLYVNIEFWFLNYALIMVKIWIFPSQITIFFCSVKLKIAKLAKCSGLSVGIRCSRVHEWVRPKDFSARRDFAVRCWASSWVVGKV